MAQPGTSPPPSDRLSTAQWMLILVLAAVQFTHIIDFMLVMPLARPLSADLNLEPAQFAFIVSSYSIAACAAALVLASVVDRFDRKHALVSLFAAFTGATLFCGWAPDYAWLIVGRIAAGAFGGVAGGVVLSIVGDAIPLARRGTAMGAVFSSFSVATIVGIPAGLYLAGDSPAGWRYPFVVLGLLCAALLPVMWFSIPRVRGHIAQEGPAVSMWEVLAEPRYLRAFAFMFALNLSGWLVFPFTALFLQNNLGLSKFELQLMYSIGGTCTLVSMNLVGRLADRYSRVTIFQVFGTLALVPVVWVPFLPAGATLALVLTATTTLMVLTSARGVPAFALLTSVPDDRVRGTFLSLNSAVQQVAMAMGPVVASLFLAGGKDIDALSEDTTPLVGYERAGLLSAAVGLVSVFLVRMLPPPPAKPRHDEVAGTPLAASPRPPVESIVTPAKSGG